MILLTWLTLKTPCHKNLGHSSHTSRDITDFVLKFQNFRYRGSEGRSQEISMTGKLSNSKKTLFGARVCDISPAQADLQLILH